MAGVPPPSHFDRVRLILHIVPPQARWGRICSALYPDPLGYGKGPSRFSDPRRRTPAHRFGVLYLGETLQVCFLEAVLRDQRDGLIGSVPMHEDELAQRQYAVIETEAPLRLVDLRGSAAVQMGVPTDVHRATRQTLSRRWSLAFYQHPARPDGIIYPSRLNGQTNLAIYDRAVPRLRTVQRSRLIETPGLAALLDQFQVALAGPDADEQA